MSISSKPTNTQRSGTINGMRENMKKATTEMLVLFLLKQRPMYAYEMIREMARLSEGVFQFNTLYLAIYRLQGYGYVTENEKVITENNRTRVYFSITKEGLVYLQEITREYRLITDTIDKMLRLDGAIYEEGSL